MEEVHGHFPRLVHSSISQQTSPPQKKTDSDKNGGTFLTPTPDEQTRRLGIYIYRTKILPKTSKN